MGDLIQFPKVVKIAQLFNEGLYGLVVDNIKDINVYETSIMVWFNEGREEGRPWDISFEYATPEEAQQSYEDLIKSIKQLKFQVIKGDKK